MLQGKAREANIVIQKSYWWWHWRGVVLPVCNPYASASVSTLSPVVIEALGDRAVLSGAAATAAPASFLLQQQSLLKQMPGLSQFFAAMH